MKYIEVREAFFKILKDIFIGAKIEGDSGYVNLMKIKSKYYQHFNKQLLQDMEVCFKKIDANTEAKVYVLEHLYTFFNKYFSDNGSIFFAYTQLKDKVTEKVYQQDKDVSLFWKTHMLYYIKTDKLYKDFLIQDTQNPIIEYFFSVQNLPLKQNNERKDIVFELNNIEYIEEQTDEAIKTITKINFDVKYAENGSKTKTEEILKKITKEDKKFKFMTEKELEFYFNTFKKQTEVDFFINKNAKKFLQEQLNFYIQNYLLSDDTLFQQEKLNHIKTIKIIGDKIIQIVSQFEDELVKIWNKPKFVHSSNYVITIDKITNQDVLKKIYTHKNLHKQIDEWIKLGFFESISLEEITTQKYKFLPIDTKYFKDIELDIVALFDNLDQQLDGWLIHSENYQALNTLQHKFKEKIQTIYIDPPYNTNASEILYVNGYKESSWLSLMENRLTLSKYFMDEEAVLVLAIDDTQLPKVSILLTEIYNDYDINTVVINHHPAGAGLEKSNISTTHEYAIFITPKGKKKLYGELKENTIDDKIGFIRTGTADSNLRVGRPNSFYAVLVDTDKNIVVGVEPPPKDDKYPIINTECGYKRIYPVSSNGVERVWRRSYNSCIKEIEKGNIISSKNHSIYLKTYSLDSHKPIFSNWLDKKYNAGVYGTNILKDIIGDSLFSYPKSLYTVCDCISLNNKYDKDSIILDYFAGSGTTAHAVIELNKKDEGERKYILVEMGKHFDNVIIPRLKKVCFSDKWKDGKAQESGEGVSQFFKYFSLEQYEEVLKKSVYEDKSPMTMDIYEQYLFMKDLKLSSVVSEIDDAAERVRIDITKLHSKIDIAETLSHLRGKFIKQITAEKVVFADGEELVFEELSHKDIKALVWW
ncbi:MAG: site-specific DNA-methyltransferase [Bacteroidetes bacterium]|nr:MAG: site-specific DNA-methyltransferase [Bacteroidota bacterium]